MKNKKAVFPEQFQTTAAGETAAKPKKIMAAEIFIKAMKTESQVRMKLFFHNVSHR